MKIFSLTNIGRSLAKTPARSITPGWQVVYFLRRKGGQATDDQIAVGTGLGRGQVNITMNDLVRKKVVTILSG